LRLSTDLTGLLGFLLHTVCQRRLSLDNNDLVARLIVLLLLMLLLLLLLLLLRLKNDENEALRSPIIFREFRNSFVLSVVVAHLQLLLEVGKRGTATRDRR